ncbi:MAG: nicotinate phosphoribosyltransferase, partial [Nitrospira sp.]
AQKIVALAPSLQAKNIPVKGVRLDSGDLADHARKVRTILDEGGLPHATILASGNLDEYRLRELIRSRAPIDSFAVGTAMTTSADAPSLDCAYKLQEYAGRPCRKRSEGKATWPGRKQVYRERATDGQWSHDLLTTSTDRHEGEGLLQPVIRDGQFVKPLPSLMDSRRHAAEQLRQLPLALKQLEVASPYEVRISEALRLLTEQVDKE